MPDVNFCPECGVPSSFSAGQAWLNNGDIIQKTGETARMMFMECQNLDPLFANIGIIVGFPIEELIQNITARGAAIYMERLIPKELKELIRCRQIDLGFLINSVILYSHVLGYGKYEFVGFRYEGDAGDFYKQRILRPFSVPQAAGNLAGVLATAVGGEHAVTYEKIAPQLFEFTASWTEYPEALKKKLVLKGVRAPRRRHGARALCRLRLPPGARGIPLVHRGGHHRERPHRQAHGHAGSGVPGHVSSRRCGDELGETIPSVVIEAQRRFTKTGFYSIDQVQNEDEFRTQLALRGLGNLRMIRMGTRGLRMRIDNAATHLMTVGMAQGLLRDGAGRGFARGVGVLEAGRAAGGGHPGCADRFIRGSPLRPAVHTSRSRPPRLNAGHPGMPERSTRWCSPSGMRRPSPCPAPPARRACPHRR